MLDQTDWAVWTNHTQYSYVAIIIYRTSQNVRDQ